MTEIEIIDAHLPERVKRGGYKETAVCFLSGNQQVLDNTYPLSEGDRSALNCINKELEDQRMEAVLKKWSVTDRRERKRNSKADRSQRADRLTLFDILAFAVQLIAVAAAMRWRG